MLQEKIVLVNTQYTLGNIQPIKRKKKCNETTQKIIYAYCFCHTDNTLIMTIK